MVRIISLPQLTGVMDDNNKESEVVDKSFNRKFDNEINDLLNVCTVNAEVRTVSVHTPQYPCSTVDNTDEKKISSLGAIALEYDNSESDTEDEQIGGNSCTKKACNDKTHATYESSGNHYRVGTVITYESENDESSSSEDSSPAVTDGSDNNSEDSDNEKGRGVRTKGRRECYDKEPNSELDALPPIEDLKISMPEVLCDPLGEVAWIVDRLVVVKPKPGKPTLNLDTVLFVEKGQRALGRIFDVFGQVAEPHYCVRFNSSNHIKESDVKVSMTVYYCPNTPYTSLVFLHELTKIKGSDAVGDDEPPEFSDDEEERAYYASLKQKQSNERRKENEDVAPCKKRRPDTGWQSNHPWNRNAKFQGGRKDPRNGKNRFFQGLNWNSSASYLNQYWPSDQRQAYPVYGGQYGYPSYLGDMQNMHSHEMADRYLYANTNSTNALAPPALGISFGTSPRFSSARTMPTAAAMSSGPLSHQYLHFPYEDSSTTSHSSPWSMPPPPPPPPLPPPPQK